MRVLTLDLFAFGALRGEAVPTLLEPMPTHTVVLNLIPSRTSGEGEYRLRLLRDGVEVWIGQGLRADARGFFTVVVPGALLRPGAYALQVRVEAGGEEETFRLVVAEEP